MRSKAILILSVLISATNSYAKLEAHEWGTFTSLVGSNGVTQDGMYHEDEALPAFVHGFGEVAPRQEETPRPTPTPRQCEDKACFGRRVYQNNVITQKMETPVIYFYTDKEQKVSVNVKFPQGVVTETFPAPVKTFPMMQDNLVIANGDTTFEVTVTTNKTDKIPNVEPGNIYGHARNVNSNVVRNGREVEKFIFYRGIGRFQPQMSMRSGGGDLTIAETKSARLPRDMFLIHVDANGHGQLLELDRIPEMYRAKNIPAARIQQLSNHTATAPAGILSGDLARGTLIKSLVGSGLNVDEAEAMINTWENGYLKVPGLRLLYILPRAEVDKNLPLTITPTPDNLERVFVGRIEVLLDTEEERILNEVINSRIHHAAALGRFAEPILRRVLQVYQNRPAQDPNIVSKIQALIEQASTGVSLSSSVH